MAYYVFIMSNYYHSLGDSISKEREHARNVRVLLLLGFLLAPQKVTVETVAGRCTRSVIFIRAIIVVIIVLVRVRFRVVGVKCVLNV
jgi:hypothetical protein